MKDILSFFLKLFSKKYDPLKSESTQKAVRSFSLTQKTLFWFFVCVFVLCGLILLEKVNRSFLVDVPAHGGELTEGIIGTPRFINPLLAITDADKDVVSLVYSGLMRALPDGTVVPDLAESYDISDDGLTYTFKIRDNAKFQDGTKVTADDVVFTINKALDPALKSPKRGNWDGISVVKVDDRTVQFNLKQSYGPFLENTTMGILPSHLWKNADSDQFSFSDLNVSPVGSGPYRVSSIKKNSSGIPTAYTLKSFSGFALGEAKIATINLRFYQNEDALMAAYKNGDIDSAYGLGAEAVASLQSGGARVDETILPRIFGVFFNQNQAQVFANKEVRVALDQALDKNRIIDEVLFGYGTVIDSPMPPRDFATTTDQRSEDERIEEASTTLAKAGWKKGEDGIWAKKDKKNSFSLSFSIATSDAPELKKAAQIIKEDWEKLGANVDLQIFETGDLNQNIIRQRKYDALLFGEIVGRDHDLYPFWHSTQRNDPGLNIAMYVNNTADKLLEDARSTTDTAVRDEKYQEFESEIDSDRPAVFIYSPAFLYILPKNLKGISLGELTTPSDRFANVYKWYTDTDKVWKIFTN